jgi:hypothetical protein
MGAETAKSVAEADLFVSAQSCRVDVLPGSTKQAESNLQTKTSVLEGFFSCSVITLSLAQIVLDSGCLDANMSEEQSTLIEAGDEASAEVNDNSKISCVQEEGRPGHQSKTGKVCLEFTIGVEKSSIQYLSEICALILACHNTGIVIY